MWREIQPLVGIVSKVNHTPLSICDRESNIFGLGKSFVQHVFVSYLGDQDMFLQQCHRSAKKQDPKPRDHGDAPFIFGKQNIVTKEE